MDRRFWSYGLTLGAFVCLSLQAHAGDSLLQFDGGVGVDPVAGVAAQAVVTPTGNATINVPVTNTVLGVPPGGRPWIVRKLRASVQADGRISVRGNGLLLSGGDGIGTRAGITQVFATLFCSGTPHHSPPADLDTGGNFRIQGVLSAVPPNPCSAPVLLIRNAAVGPQSWFAAGLLGGDD